MPKYDYKCNVCLNYTEFERRVEETKEPFCCNQVMTRQWSSFGVQFKGNGFYSTDKRK